MSLLLPPEAAQHTRLTENWLEKARCRGDGPPFIRLGARKVAYRLEDLDAWIASRPRRTNTSDCPRPSRPTSTTDTQARGGR